MGRADECPRSCRTLQAHRPFAGGAVTMPGCSRAGGGCTPSRLAWGLTVGSWYRRAGCVRGDWGRKVWHQAVSGACPPLLWPVTSPPQHSDGLEVCLGELPAPLGLRYFAVPSTGLNSVHLSEAALSAP